MATTAERLRYLIDSRGLKQVDILRLAAPFCKKYMVKLNKSDLSQFVSGKVSPGRFKLRVLALALDVNENWLMGMDVPMGPYGENSTTLSDDSLYMDDPLTADLKAEIDTLSPSHKELLLAQIQIMKARNSK